MEKLRHREGKGFAQNHRAGWWQRWVSPSSIYVPSTFMLSVQHQNPCPAFGHLPHSCIPLWTFPRPNICFPGIHCKGHKHVTWIQPIMSSHPRLWLQNQSADLAPIVLFTPKPPTVWFVTSANKKLLDKMTIRLELNWSNPCLGARKTTGITSHFWSHDLLLRMFLWGWYEFHLLSLLSLFNYSTYLNVKSLHSRRLWSFWEESSRHPHQFNMISLYFMFSSLFSLCVCVCILQIYILVYAHLK